MKSFFYLALTTLLLTLTSACSTESNGDLDGNWHLVTMDSVSAGTSRNMVPERIFWAVEARMMQIQKIGELYKVVNIRFEHRGDSLLLSDPRLYRAEDNTFPDTPMTDLRVLRLYGIDSVNERYAIRALTDDAMVLESRKVRLHFEKF